MSRVQLACPLCGMSLSKGWKALDPARLSDPVVARHYRSLGGRRGFAVSPVHLSEVSESSRWFIVLRGLVARLAEIFGVVSVRKVVQEVIPDWVRLRITELEDRLRGMMKYIDVLEEELYRVRVNVVDEDNHRVSWGGCVQSLGSRVSVRVKKVESKDVGW